MSSTAAIRSRRRSFRRQPGIFLICAHLAWITPILVVLFTGALHLGLLHLAQATIVQLAEASSLAGLLISLGTGVAALFGIRRHGLLAILIPVVAGAAIWLALLVRVLPSIKAARRRIIQARVVHPADGLRAAVRAPGANRLTDEFLDFSLDLPAGFAALPPDKVVPGYRYAYVKPGAPGEPGDILLVKNLQHFLQPKHLTAASLPSGKELTVETFDWRGLAIDVVRVPSEKGGKPYLEYDVQVPLKRGGIQIAFGGVATEDATLRQRIAQTLASLDGETNW